MANSTRICPAGLGHTSIRHFTSGSFENSDVVVGTPGQLLSLVVSNKGSALTLQLFDALSLPANSTVPSVIPILVPANTTVSVSFASGVSSKAWAGWAFNTGLVWAASTTQGTLTVDATSSLWVDCRFVN